MSYTALYRKYRPATFDEVVGQDHITKTLRNQIMSGRVGHAYLFNGGRGTGKTSSAKILARAINCLNPEDGNPCNECDICKAALNGSLTDIVEMDAASNNSVEDIRSIRDEVNFLPTVAKYRVYIIDEVHMLSIGAFNALLKTLEEPPEHVKFILATTEPQKLPATILSRCQRFDYKKLSSEYIKKRLNYICEADNINIDDDALNTISVLAEGAMRDGISILERCLQEDSDKITNEMVKNLVGLPKLESVNKIINNILDYNIEESIQSVNDVLEDGKDIQNLIWEIIKYTKDILVYKTTNHIDIYNEEEVAKINALAEKTTKERLLDTIFYLSELSNELRMTTQKTILFQVGIMKLCNKNLKSEEHKNTIDQTPMEVQSVAISEDIENRISNIENKLQRTINAVQKLLNNIQVINNSAKNVENSQEKKTNNVNRSASNNQNLKNLLTTQTSNVNVDAWPKIVSSIKESGKVMLYSNLANSKAYELNDMTIGISFPDGLTPFGKSVIAMSENLSELTKLVSTQYGKTMQIRLIENTNEKSEDSGIDSIMNDLDLPINIID
ncbi:MAG: DNA polymerase III subunit gamma/tau [Clostridia bacterium]|nr:DNA polymerase III subunit gamma/tau [Clostridia bacterium]MBP3707601.1 DNA polymerase III subunit gamma/tau [Clostridia bacterium]